MARWSKMTYEMVATTIRQIQEGYGPQVREGYGHVDDMGMCSLSGYAALKQTGEDFASIFEKDNPRFDRSWFLRACGLEVTP